MPSTLPVYKLIPDPWRGWIGLRRARRWLRATRFAAAHNRSLPADAPTLNFYPMRPEPNASIAYVARRLAARITFKPGGPGLTLAWDTGTWFSKSALRRLPADAVNRRCVDISKTLVDRTWADVAGYSIAVDPATTRGPLVVKPDQNGTRGGRVVEGPLRSSKSGFVYQRLVDTKVGDRVLQIRPVMLKGKIILVYEKWRPHPRWFEGPEQTFPKQIDDFFSPEEVGRLLLFAERIGMNYGELDVVRDANSHLIYVVDANRTPVRPKGLADKDVDAAFGPQAEAFASLLSR